MPDEPDTRTTEQLLRTAADWIHSAIQDEVRGQEPGQWVMTKSFVDSLRDRADRIELQAAQDRADEARETMARSVAEKILGATEHERKLIALRRYLGDLCFVAPEIFPEGQQVQRRCGQILDMW